MTTDKEIKKTKIFEENKKYLFSSNIKILRVIEDVIENVNDSALRPTKFENYTKNAGSISFLEGRIISLIYIFEKKYFCAIGFFGE